MPDHADATDPRQGAGAQRLAVVAGSTGLIGSALVDRLLVEGWRVRRLVRPGTRPGHREVPGGAAGGSRGTATHHDREAGPRTVTPRYREAERSTVTQSDRGAAPGTVEDSVWDPTAARIDPGALDGAALVVNLAGAGLGDRRWTKEYKATLTLSRTSSTSLLATTLARALDSGRTEPGVRYLQGSAVGYYGDGGESILTESSPPGEGFLADLCRTWEQAARPAADAGAGVVLLRTGIVLSQGGGALGRVLPLARLGLSGPLGGGRQWWPWITLTDHVSAQVHLADSALTGPVNLAAPGEARQKEVLRALSRQLRRPFGLPVPGIALRVALGEFAQDVLSSQRMHPDALLADRFTFTHPDVASAARWVIHGD